MNVSGSRRTLDLLKMGGFVVLGRAAAAGLTFAAILLLARELGPEQFGIFSVIWAYVVVIDRLVNSQSWQSLIRFGTQAQSDNDQIAYRQLIKTGFLLDAFTAVLGTVIAIGGVPLLGYLFGWDDPTRIWATLFCFVVLFNLSGVPLAVLRMRDRFGPIVAAELVAAVLRLGLVLLAVHTGAQLGHCIAIWVFCEFVAKAILVIMTIRELGFSETKQIATQSLKGVWKTRRSFFSAIFITNMEGVVRVFREADTLIVAFMLGNAAAGTYKIARQLGNIVMIYVEPLYQVIYPELSRLIASGNKTAFVTISLKFSAFAGLVSSVVLLGFYLVGEPVLLFILGTDYAESFGAAVWVLASALVWSIAHPLTPGHLALGAFRDLLNGNIIATISYIVLLIVGGQIAGLTGSVIAFFAYNLIWLALMLISQRRALRQYETVPHPLP